MQEKVQEAKLLLAETVREVEEECKPSAVQREYKVRCLEALDLLKNI